VYCSVLFWERSYIKKRFHFQGIELGNYLIKEVASGIMTEFPAVQLLSSLSPIPSFKAWLFDKLKQGNRSDTLTKNTEKKIIMNAFIPQI
jgi:hypothetical protein